MDQGHKMEIVFVHPLTRAALTGILADVFAANPTLPLK